MPTANVFLYGVSHGLCLSEDKVLEEFERRGVSLADPWLPSSYASQPAGGWRRVGVEMEYERVLDVQRRWSRPITWCEAFALCFEWQTLRPSNRVDEKEVALARALALAASPLTTPTCPHSFAPM